MFIKKVIEFFTFLTLGENCLFFWQKILCRVATTQFCVSIETLFSEHFYIESFDFFFIRGRWTGSSCFLTEIFWLSCQNCILRVQGNILTNFFRESLMFLIIFGYWANIIRSAGKIFSIGLWKLLPMFQAEHLWEKVFLKVYKYLLNFSN